jgi:hypothetical protein
MEAHEDGTHESLKAHLEQFIEPKIKDHGGHTIKNTGDGFLSEFSSVTDAVLCAVEMQRGMLDRERDVPKERRILFRIGVDLGDVIVEKQDIFGHRVNLAARLQALAEPGGICISGIVYESVYHLMRENLDIEFENMGEQQVKNIARPVGVWRIRLGRGLASRAPPGLTIRKAPSLQEEFSIMGIKIGAYTVDAKLIQIGIPNVRTVSVGSGRTHTTQISTTVPYIFELEDRSHSAIDFTNFSLPFAIGVRVIFLVFKDAKGKEVLFSVYNRSDPRWIELPYDHNSDLSNEKERKGIALLLIGFSCVILVSFWFKSAIVFLGCISHRGCSCRCVWGT